MLGSRRGKGLKWPFEREDADRIMSNIARLNGDVTLHLQQAVLSLGQDTYGGVLQAVKLGQEASKEAHRTSSILSEQQTERKRHQILEWLSGGLAFDSFLIKKGEEAVAGTGEWLFDENKFMTWMAYQSTDSVSSSESDDDSKPTSIELQSPNQTSVHPAAEPDDSSISAFVRSQSPDPLFVNPTDYLHSDEPFRLEPVRLEHAIDLALGINRDQEEGNEERHSVDSSGDDVESDWISDDDFYCGKDQTLWCWGIPGAGKD